MNNENVSNNIKENTKKVWGTNPAGWTFGNKHQKGTKEFFQAVIERRYQEECDWFKDIIKFERFKEKKVLEIGCGAGYDAYMFCKHGADYTGIDITPENEILAKKHLAHFDYHPRIFCMDAEEMNFDNEFDYVFSFGVLHHTPNISKALSNIYKALKSGGETQIIVYHKNSIFYWLNIFLTQWIIRRGFLKRSLSEELSFIENTQSNTQPLVNVYTKRNIKKLLKKQRFQIKAIHIRKLVHEDLIAIAVIRKFAHRIPQSILNFLAKKFGWYICITAIKE